MYVCMYVYIYVCVCGYVCVCVRMWMYVCMYVSMNECMYVRTYAYMHTYTCCSYIHAWTVGPTCMHACMYVDTSIAAGWRGRWPHAASVLSIKLGTRGFNAGDAVSLSHQGSPIFENQPWTTAMKSTVLAAEIMVLYGTWPFPETTRCDQIPWTSLTRGWARLSILNIGAYFGGSLL